MIIKDGTKINGIPVDSTTILGKGRVVPNIKIAPTMITVHNTSNPNATAENHKKFLVNHNKADATGAISSWHFTIDNTKVVQHIDTLKMGYHAGKTNGNKISIGIEISEFTDAKKQAKALENAKAFVRYLMNQHNIPIENVVPHQHWTGKHCPRVIIDNGGFDEFKKDIPKTITVNGATATATKVKTTTATTTAKAETVSDTAPSVASTKVGKYTFKATDTHIGVVEVVYDGEVNIRQKADLTSTVVKKTKKGEGWKVSAITNGLYKIGNEAYITSNAKYVKYVDNPYLDNNGKALPKAVATATASGITSTKTLTGKLKVKVDNLFVYNTADWNDKGQSVNAGEVFTIVKELVVQDAKMYQLKSGLFITASTKYVELI